MTEKKTQDKVQWIENALPKGTKLKSGKHTYYIEKVLGVGGFGITYKAYTKAADGNIKHKIYYAIKEHFMKGCYRGGDATTVLYPPTIKNDMKLSRKDFENEAEKLTKLCKLSEHIVKVNETFKANETVYYVMEYLGGGDLARIVRKNKGALSETVALSLIVPIAKAVKILHSEETRFLHLDIKPENIVMKTDEFTGTDYPVLIDFGTARHFDKNGNPSSFSVAKGVTEGFSPIEQYETIGRFDARLDVYALGATLFYLLTGKTPVKAQDISGQYIMDALPANISERTREAIVHAMQQNKNDRTASVNLFLQEISDTYDLQPHDQAQSPNQKKHFPKAVVQSCIKQLTNRILAFFKRDRAGSQGEAEQK